MAKNINYQKEAPVSKSGLPKLQNGDPEYTISLVGLVMSVAGQPVVGLILSAIGLRQSKAAGRSNTYALLGLVFGIIFSLMGVLLAALYVIIGVITYFMNGQGTF